MSNQAQAVPVRHETLSVVDESGELIYIVDGIEPGTGNVARFGIAKQQITMLVDRRNCVRLAQFMKLVVPGLIIARDIFQGLKRPLCYDENLNGDAEKLVYSWKPQWDYDWDSTRSDERGIIQMAAPSQKVFVVIATPNSMRQRYPNVDYWIENNWVWVEADANRPSAPINWSDRYDRSLTL